MIRTLSPSLPGYRPPWVSYLVVALAVALGWGLRGVHGHERGGAIAGAIAGLSLAAVTGDPRWLGASVLGSLGFAIGGSLSYGRFVSIAAEGAWHGLLSLILIGVAWGGLGGLVLGLGLALPQYRNRERMVIGAGLLVVWGLIEFPTPVRMVGLSDLLTRDLLTLVLLGGWGMLTAYLGVWKQDRRSLQLGLAGAVGFGIGFPLAAWVQGVGQMTGVALDWWKVAEHLIGACGGLALALMACRFHEGWVPPKGIGPWERWGACAWVLWVIPAWALANDLAYWTTERAVLSRATADVIVGIVWVGLAAFALFGAQEIRRGRYFTISWFPHQLRALFLTFVWMVTAIGILKTLLPDGWSSWGPTQTTFLGLAAAVTLLLPKPPHHWRPAAPSPAAQ